MIERDEAARVRRQAELLGRDSLNQHDRYRLELADREEARTERRRAEERAQRRQQERQATTEQLRTEMAALRAEMHGLHAAMIEATGQAVAEFSDQTLKNATTAVRDIQRELLSLVEQRFAELKACFDRVLSEARAQTRPKDFKFSSERGDGDVVDLPNPLIRKFTVN
jgi:hypothetical protein